MTARNQVSGGATLADYQLEDRYNLASGRVYLSGSQALVRLPMLQRERDVAAGLNTAGFISGYTGSPLGGYDIALKQAQPLLEQHHIHFQPGLNEDLGATAVWGSQQIDLIEGARYDGVFGIWYGKGPGVDRSGDALKHGSYNGAATHGGVLALAGDDHGAKSSTTAHQSDHAFIHFGMPFLNPSNVQDYLDFGLYGFALSRYSGCWVGMKCVTDTVESSASVSIDPERVRIVLPADDQRPPEGLNLRWGLPAQAVEIRQYQQRLPAAQAFIRANGLDRVVIDSSERRLGIVTSGKAYLDVMQALDELELDAAGCSRLGISVYKVAMPWPLEPANALAFATGQAELLCIEEKRPVIEDQLAKLLVNLDQRPRLVGKTDEHGAPLINAEGELAPVAVALAIGRRLLALIADPKLEARLATLSGSRLPAPPGAAMLTRLPSFCAGCPHNTSTIVPEGSIAFGGIGCHGMATFLPERRTPILFQMGAEGAPWIGIAPFSATSHIFQNLGDGTYYHSGLLAIRAAVAAGVNMTYKILVNDAIAMTGGQQIEGQMRVDALTRQVDSEGVSRIAVVSDNTEQYRQGADFAGGVTIHHRDELDAVQREFREVEGVSVIVYDQHCATELRRRRKRGSVADPDQRTFINQRVCEGCGDCSVQSNCIAIEPVETDFGRKRRINQSACNKDFSCLKGYCPSFVTVRGATPRRRGSSTGTLAIDELAAALPTPVTAATTVPYNILVTGIGGSGVVTLGALLGVAAHLEGKSCSVLDVAGLAQRNGPVTSHVRIADAAGNLHASRIAVADLIIGSDIVVTAGRDVLGKIAAGRTRAIVNTHVAPTSAFAFNPDLDLSAQSMQEAIAGNADADAVEFIAATELAYALLGNEVAANLFLVGYAVQKGWLPISLAALERAIDLNGVAVAMNRTSLAWGRLAAHDLVQVERSAGRSAVVNVEPERDNLDAVIERNATELIRYQDAAYAERYRHWVERTRSAERAVGADTVLTLAVARYYYKLLAYKDEYEVARLYSAPEFMARLREEFEGDFSIEFNMAPPLLQRRAPRTGRYRKRTFGPWMLGAFKWLARMKRLRGTRLDPFGYSHHRRIERQLIADYEAMLAELLPKLNAGNHSTAVELAELPEIIRGYDIVKECGIDQARIQRELLIAQFHRARPTQTIPVEVVS